MLSTVAISNYDDGGGTPFSYKDYRLGGCLTRLCCCFYKKEDLLLKKERLKNYKDASEKLVKEIDIVKFI